MNPITDGIVGAVSGIVGKVIDRLFPDPIAQANARLELLKMEQAGELAALSADVTLATNQTNVDTEEAKSTNIFIAGWRPFIGWVCGTGFAIQVLGPLLEWGTALAGHAVKFPVMDYTLLQSTLFGMLGLGGLRTFEKWKGVEDNR